MEHGQSTDNMEELTWGRGVVKTGGTVKPRLHCSDADKFNFERKKQLLKIFTLIDFCSDF